MDQQERELILSLAQKVQQAAITSKDIEADALIQANFSNLADALYVLVPTVLIQEAALKQQSEQLKNLQAQLATIAQQPAKSKSFLGDISEKLFGSSTPAVAPGKPALTPTTSPQPAATAGSSSFLQSAATTAMGVAGGALLFEGVKHLMGGSNAYAGSLHEDTTSVASSEQLANNDDEQDHTDEDEMDDADDNTDYQSDDSGDSFSDDSF